MYVNAGSLLVILQTYSTWMQRSMERICANSQYENNLVNYYLNNKIDAFSYLIFRKTIPIVNMP